MVQNMDMTRGLEAAVYLKPSRCGCKKTSVLMWHHAHIAQGLSAIFDVMEPVVAREKLYWQRFLPLEINCNFPDGCGPVSWSSWLGALVTWTCMIFRSKMADKSMSRECKPPVEGFGAPVFFLSWLCKSFPAQFMGSAAYFGSNWIKWKLPITSC